MFKYRDHTEALMNERALAVFSTKYRVVYRSSRLTQVINRTNRSIGRLS